MTAPALAPRVTAADWKLHTAPLTTKARSGDALPEWRLRGIGSSTVIDLQGDRMMPSVLEDMANCDAGLTIFRNHSYNSPEDVVGILTSRPEIQMSGGIADLWITFDVLPVRQEAIEIYNMVMKGLRQGISVGLQVSEYHFEDGPGGTQVCCIDHAQYTAEWSTVGIPANQRSWVEHAISGLFAKTLDERLAPIAKSLLPKDYGKTIERIADADMREHFINIAPRSVGDRIVWYPAQERFVLQKSNSTNGRMNDLSRAEVLDLIKHVVPDAIPDDVIDITPVDTTKAANDDAHAAQEKRSKACGIGIKEGGHLTCPSQFASIADQKQAWGDYTNYAYPMPDKSHADNAAARWADTDNHKGYSSKEQGIISDAITARQRHFGETPDDKEKSIGDDVAMPEDVVNLEKATVPAANDVDVAADGTHVKCKGTHSHSHDADNSQGDDATHTHSHEHDNDNMHSGAAHDGGSHKSVEPSVTADAPAVTTPEVPAIIPAIDAPVMTPKALAVPTDDPAFVLWKSMGENLGYMPTLAKCNLVGNDTDAQRVISLVSELDRDSDAMQALWQQFNFGNFAHNVDLLMALLSIPDPDQMNQTYQPPTMGEQARDPMTAYAATLAMLTKAGAQHSAATMQGVQAAHHMLCSVFGAGMCKDFMGMTPSNTPTGDQADHPQETQPLDSGLPGLQMDLTHSWQPMRDEMDALAKAISGVSVVDLVTKAKAEIERELASTVATVKHLQGEQAKVARSLEETKAAAQAFAEKVNTLSDVSLGIAPTMRRTMSAGQPVASYEDFAALANKGIDGTKLMQHPEQGIVRFYPKGVGPREPLTAKQLSRMTEGQEYAYAHDDDVYVPEP